jgi:hypothetical protein
MQSDYFDFYHVLVSQEIHIIDVNTGLILTSEHVFKQIDSLLTQDGNLTPIVNLNSIFTWEGDWRDLVGVVITEVDQFMLTIEVNKRELDLKSSFRHAFWNDCLGGLRQPDLNVQVFYGKFGHLFGGVPYWLPQQDWIHRSVVFKDTRNGAQRSFLFHKVWTFLIDAQLFGGN